MLKFLKRLRQDTDGSAPVDAILMFPLLFWAVAAMFVYFDGFRAKTINLKAAYTIGDVISRETQPIDAKYLNSMNDLFEILNHSKQPSQLRVTLVRYSKSRNAYYVDWSKAVGAKASLTDASLSTIEHRLPPIPTTESVIVVETWMAHEPPFSIGLSAFNMNTLTVTRPRFSPQVVWRDS